MSRAAAALVLLAGACGRISEGEAVGAVRRYNEAVIEAYRSGDPALVEPVAGAREAKKLFGLIGAKTDMGITLDAQLVDFATLQVDRGRETVTVLTRETWRYADRRIGTGQPVGAASEDHYQMLSLLAREDGRWVVQEVRFAAPPQVGRERAMASAPARALHGATQEPK